MKKLLSLTLALALTLVFASCSGKKTENNNVNDDLNNGTEVEDVQGSADEAVYENPDLLALADSLYASFNADELPMLGSMEILPEDFEYYTFIPYEEGLTAVVSEPMMGSIAHSVVIVKASDAETAKTVAEQMKTNANPRKWICVEAENVITDTNGNLAILVMSDSKAQTIVDAFKAVNAETMPVMGEEILPDEGEDFADVETEETDAVVDVDVPATMPGENEPAVMPEVDVPAVMPDIDTPAVMPEIETDEAPEVDTPVADPAIGGATVDTLFELADKLYTGINPEEMPMVGTMELTEENFEYSAFVPYKSTYLAVENMPMMGSMPHSVVIVKAESEEEAAKLAEDMKANANPRKWICVGARSVKSASKGNLAILVMTSVDVFPDGDIDEEKAEQLSAEKSEERADIIINNFLANA